MNLAVNRKFVHATSAEEPEPEITEIKNYILASAVALGFGDSNRFTLIRVKSVDFHLLVISEFTFIYCSVH